MVAVRDQDRLVEHGQFRGGGAAEPLDRLQLVEGSKKVRRLLICRSPWVRFSA
jgi:hypothetical protein